MGGWLAFERRKEWDSLVVSKEKSHQLGKSILVFSVIFSASIADECETSLEQPVIWQPAANFAGPCGLQQRTDLAALHKPQYPKVALCKVLQTVCVCQTHEDFTFFF